MIATLSKLSLIAFLAFSTTASPLPVRLSGRRVGFDGGPEAVGNLARKRQFQRLVVFGDSFSDDGHGTWIVSNQTWPADSAYYNHAFSNGPVWPVVLSELMGISGTLIDKAIGGATSDNAVVQGYTGLNSTIPVPSMLDQIAQYINESTESNDADGSIYALIIGVNDIFLNASVSAESVAQAIVKGMQQLQNSKGASNFILAPFPDLALLPFAGKYTPPEYQTVLSAYSKGLAGSLSLLASAPPEGIRIAYIDLYTLFPQMLAQPESFGFSSEVFDQSCLSGVYSTEAVPRSVCSDPDERIFWDIYHPSAKTHSIIAAEAVKALDNTF